MCYVLPIFLNFQPEGVGKYKNHFYIADLKI